MSERVKLDAYRAQGGMCCDCDYPLPFAMMMPFWDGGLFLLCPPCHVDASVERMIERGAPPRWWR